MARRVVLTGQSDPRAAQGFVQGLNVGYPKAHFDTLYVSPASLDVVNPSTPPTWQTFATGSQVIKALRFAQPAPDANFASFAIEVPYVCLTGLFDPNWMMARVLWTPLVGGIVGDVGWRINWVTAEISAVFGDDPPPVDLTQAADLVARTYQATPFVPVPVQRAPREMVMGTIWRDADTWTSDEAYLLGIEFAVPAVTVGSGIAYP